MSSQEMKMFMHGRQTMNLDIDAKKLLAVGAIGLFGLAGLTACGTEDEDGSGSSSDTTEAAEDAGEEAPADGDGTSIDAPLAADSSVEVGDWTVAPSDIKLDATDEILGHNEFNDPPADGSQLALFTVDGTYNGSETGSLWFDVTVGIWADGTFYDSTDCLNVVPEDLTEAPEVSNGGTAAGATCVEIPSDAETYLVYFEDLMSFDGTKYFVEIG
ncbi:hypothetical protein L0U85_18905 [Glycomyces sp. L485]|uniref:hypothetical protein n=1 Tax=Glycomyces sp. L485 TaxID=2909235 RepID=UPI001F4B209F|nr:hypothetical protein [Glycomyces sp. L485]MCH7232906.1 hypothetical protein [Glycomyces sp. L485]